MNWHASLYIGQIGERSHGVNVSDLGQRSCQSIISHFLWAINNGKRFYVCLYTHTHTHTHIYIFVHVCIWRVVNCRLKRLIKVVKLYVNYNQHTLKDDHTLKDKKILLHIRKIIVIWYLILSRVLREKNAILSIIHLWRWYIHLWLSCNPEAVASKISIESYINVAVSFVAVL